VYDICHNFIFSTIQEGTKIITTRARITKNAHASPGSTPDRNGEQVQRVVGGRQRTRCGPSEPALMALALNPRKKGFTRIPSALADTTPGPVGQVSRRRAHWRKEQGAGACKQIHKKKNTINMKSNQQTYLKGPHIHCITPHSPRTWLLFCREAPPLSPRFHSHWESISSS